MITTYDNYKVLEEDEIPFPSDQILHQLQLLLFDLNESIDESTDLLRYLSSFMQSALTSTVGSVTFITVYEEHISPSSFVGFALVEWMPLDQVDTVDDAYIPVLIGQKRDAFSGEDEGLKTIMQSHIRLLAESRFYMKEFQL